MKSLLLFPKQAALAAVAGAILALAILPGCKKAAHPVAPSPNKPPAGAAAAGTNTPAATATNAVSEFDSVFDDSPPPGNNGRDPFNPQSTRRNPAPPKIVNTTNTPSGPADPQLRLQSVAGREGKWVAVINNHILAVGEEEAIKVPGGSVHVKVVEIGKDYADVIVDGTQKHLTMSQRK